MKYILIVLTICASIATSAQWVKTNYKGKGAEGSMILSSGKNLIATEFTYDLDPPFEFIFVSSNQGNSWALVRQNLAFFSLHRHNTNVFGAYDRGIFRSTNDGITWKEVNDTLGVRSFLSFNSYIFAGTDNSGVMRSSDDGGTWEKASPFILFPLGTLDSSILGGTNSGKILKSTDSGTTWNDMSLGLIGGEILSMVTTPHGAFAANDSGIFILRSSPQFWRRCSNIWVNTLYAIGNIVLAATNPGVWITTDNGSTWTSFSTGLSEFDGTLPDVVFFTHDTSFVYLTDWSHNFIWRRPLSELVTTGGVSLPQAVEFNIYPNPSEQQSTISFDLPAPSSVSITILNTLGEAVGKLCNEVLPEGHHEFILNAADFLSGIYICTLKINERSVTKTISINQ